MRVKVRKMEQEKNLPTLIEKAEKNTAVRKYPMVYPISNDLRKELKKQKDKEIGDIRTQIKTLRDLKFQEFKSKASTFGKIDAILKPVEKRAKMLNKAFIELKEKAKELMKEQKDLEKDTKYIHIDSAYCDLSQLRVDKESRRVYAVDGDAFDEIAEEMFDKEYKNAFEETYKVLDDISTKFDEAVLFADLEAVKTLYFQMKESKKLFEKIEKMEV
jgi:hypothetical protein